MRGERRPPSGGLAGRLAGHPAGRLAGIGVLLLLAASPAGADVRDLRYTASKDIPVTLGAGAFWCAVELLQKNLAATDCHWCDRNADGSDHLNGLDSWGRRHFRWQDVEKASRFSDAAGFALAPAVTLGLDALAARDEDRGDLVTADAVIILQAGVVSADLAQIVKLATARERPFVHVLPAEEKARTAAAYDNNTSFYSGHTAAAFALATAAGSVASMRGYRQAGWVWAGGLAVATATGYLRVAADRHYLTDVLAGAAAGTAVGWFLPRWLHGPVGEAPDSGRRLEIAPLAGGGMVGVAARF